MVTRFKDYLSEVRSADFSAIAPTERSAEDIAAAIIAGDDEGQEMEGSQDDDGNANH